MVERVHHRLILAREVVLDLGGEPRREGGELGEIGVGVVGVVGGRGAGVGLAARGVCRRRAVRIQSRPDALCACAPVAGRNGEGGVGGFEHADRSERIVQGAAEACDQGRLAEHQILAGAAFEVDRALAELACGGAERKRLAIAVLDRACDRFDAEPAGGCGCGERSGDQQEAQQQGAAKGETKHVGPGSAGNGLGLSANCKV